MPGPADDAPPTRAGPRRPVPVVMADRCTGCGRCVAACPPHVLTLTSVAWRKSATLVDEPGCTGCSRCEVVCPVGAIEMTRPGRQSGV